MSPERIISCHGKNGSVKPDEEMKRHGKFMVRTAALVD